MATRSGRSAMLSTVRSVRRLAALMREPRSEISRARTCVWPRPASSSCSCVPSTVTLSPLETCWSRPGQAIIVSSASVTTPIGARLPYSSRSVPSRGAVTSAATNSVSPSRMSRARCPTHASTTDGANSAPTSSTPTEPSTCSTARATAGLSRSATIRTSGRRSRIKSTVSSVRRSVRSAHTTAAAPAMPASYSGSERWCEPRTMCGMPQPRTTRARRSSGSSSSTTTRAPARCSCSTVRSPTGFRPHTITWPAQSRQC
jgi:hypothetical protein